MLFPWQGPLERPGGGGGARWGPHPVKPEQSVFFSAICFILWGEIYLNTALL